MKQQRTGMVMLLAVVVSLNLPCYSQTYDPLAFDITVLTPNAVVVSGHQYDVNVLAIHTDEGMILVDTGISPAWAAVVRDTLQRIFATDRFHYVINTHYHWDHTQGNQVFPDAVIVTQERCREAMERQNRQRRERQAAPRAGQIEGKKGNGTMPPPPPSPILTDGEAGFHLSLPTLTVDDRMTLSSGGTAIEIYAYGYGHSDNDLLVYFPESGILATGDLFFKRALPIVKPWGKVFMERGLAVLGELIDTDRNISVVVPGHNELMTHEDIMQDYSYLTGLLQGVSREAAAGTGWESVLRMFQLKTFAPNLASRDVVSNTGHSLHEGNVKVIWDYFAGAPKE